MVYYVWFFYHWAERAPLFVWMASACVCIVNQPQVSPATRLESNRAQAHLLNH
jgi:hypothetical protein